VEVDLKQVPPLTVDEAKAPLLAGSAVPFVDPQHPFQGGIGVDPVGIATLVWTGRTWPRIQNRVVFSDEETDWCGMPAMAIEFELSEEEAAEVRLGVRLIDLAAGVLGRYVQGAEPRTLPLGWSFHYMGTIRMGEHDDGTSVCDSHSRVWGFRNLFVAGNGVIPTPTTCNPTLTTVAIAVHSVPEVIKALGAPN
jgi:choline dehydrogenase-like flavoprotein